MNFYNHHIRSIFKSHSISVTFKFCAVLGAQGIRATGFKRAQNNAHCAKFESYTDRMTFKTNTICTSPDIQAHYLSTNYVNSTYSVIDFPLEHFSR